MRILWAFLLVIAAGCSALDRKVASPLEIEALENATYTINEKASTLVDGHYEYPTPPDFVRSAGGVQFGEVLERLDIDADLDEDVLVLLYENGGGNAIYPVLVVVENDNGKPRQVASMIFGDRDEIRSVKAYHHPMSGLAVAVATVEHSGEDPMCCPSLVATHLFSLVRDKLVER